MIAVELPFPPSILNPNRRAHWAVKAKAFKKYKNDCLWMLKAQKPPQSRTFKMTFYPPSKRRYDRDNLIGACKALQDALATYWQIDDSEFEITYGPIGEPVKGGKVVIS